MRVEVGWWLLSFEGAFHDGADGFAAGVAEVEDAVDLLGDGEFEVVFFCQREEGGGGADAFGDHGHACKDLLQGAALAEFESDAAVAALSAVAGEDEVAHACQATERFGFTAKSYDEARHFG